MSRSAVKSGCAHKWGGWGRLSVNGPRQNNSDRSEGPWVERQKSLARKCTNALRPPTQSGAETRQAVGTKGGGKPAEAESALRREGPA